MPKYIDTKVKKTVRKLLDKGISSREIARRCDIPHSSVGNIQKTDDFLMELTPGKFQEIQSLLRAGYPIGAIEIRTKVPRDIIYLITGSRVAYGKLGPGMIARTCAKCGAVIIPPRRHPYAPCMHTTPGEITRAQSEELYRITEDIVSLNAQGVIANQLFFNLATEAVKVLGTIGAVQNAEEKKS
jgi:hypothetical protein